MPYVLSFRPRHAAASDQAGPRLGDDRTWLALCTVAALAAAGSVATGVTQVEIEPDLARLLRCMAVIKGVFAAIAFGACYWRLARPAGGWRRFVYLLGPASMAGGALCLWRLQAMGFAAVGLHAGMFALLAAALTDTAFIPALRPRRP